MTTLNQHLLRDHHHQYQVQRTRQRIDVISFLDHSIMDGTTLRKAAQQKTATPRCLVEDRWQRRHSELHLEQYMQCQVLKSIHTVIQMMLIVEYVMKRLSQAKGW